MGACHLPHGKKPIVLKWVCKVQVNPSDEVIKYKARLVAKDFLQMPEVDHGAVFEHVAILERVRFMDAIANLRK